MDSAELDFGIVDIGQVKELALTVRNIGSETLLVEGVEISRTVFQAIPQELVLAPQEAGTLIVLFSPDESASYEATMHLSSNSIEGVTNTVVLRGATPTVLKQYKDTGPGGSLTFADTFNPDGPMPDQGGANQVTSAPLPAEGMPDSSIGSPGGGVGAAGCSLIRR